MEKISVSGDLTTARSRDDAKSLSDQMPNTKTELDSGSIKWLDYIIKIGISCR